MIQIDAVTKAYGSDTILENISFTLGKREKCALVGRNGAGKTTLFRLITAQEEADSGTISFPKHYRVGYLSQHIHFSQESVLQEACTGLTQEDKDKTYLAEAILFGLGFQQQDLNKSPSIFSGGYHLRLHLTKLLLSQPDCLLLDEPTNYLDILSIRWLRQFLQAWPKELVMISHDRQFLDSISTHTIGIHRKKMKKVEGPTDKLFSQIALEEEIHEKSRQSIDKKREHMQLFVDRFGAKNTKAAQAQSRLKAINRLPSLDALCQIEDLHFRFPAEYTNSKIILRANGVSFGYSSPLIENFSLELVRQARIGIIGQNGKGKSTLLKLLLGDLAPQNGTLSSMAGLKIGYFGQSHIERLNLEHTVEEEIHAANLQLSLQEIRSICGKMMFTQARAEKKIRVLSGGERSRVLLGKLLASPCHLLLLDEPTNHLDVESMESFMDALDEFAGAVCVVTHSELLLERLATELVVFRHGSQELFLGTYNEFLQKGGWQDEEKSSVKKEHSIKDDKRKRAEWVQERARAMKPYLSQIERIEARIIASEEELTKLNQQLLDQVQQAKSSSIGETAKAIKDKQQEIENLFADLEQQNHELHLIKEEFDTTAACSA